MDSDILCNQTTYGNKSYIIKDINDLIISGKTIPEVQTIISRGTYRQLSALTKLNDWKKCSI